MSAKKATTNRTKVPPQRAESKATSPNRPAKSRVMLVDDHPTTREGMAAIINSQPDLEACCQAGSPAEAMASLAKVKPDLMVTDMTMPGRSGIEFLKDVHSMLPQLPMLVFSMHDEMLYAERALRAGARVELWGLGEPTAGLRQPTVARPGEPPIASFGGAELSLGLELAVWLTPKRRR